MFRPDGGYAAWLRRAMRPFPSDAALRTATGGEFEALGAIEAAMLRHYGLRDDDALVDVGCGTGRLANALATSFTGAYLGTDVIPAFLRVAGKTVREPNFRFVRVSGIAIPLPDASADMVCFFSVITHLLAEHAYLYLEEARRVLRPGGRIVLSFLELACAAQWDVFAASVEHTRQGLPKTLNVFTERPAIEAWSKHLALAVIDLRAGSEPFVPLAQPIRFESGAVQSELGHLGQSIAVLELLAAGAKLRKRA